MTDAEQTVRAAYRAFNDRDAAGAVELMHAEVDWPNAWEGGRVVGRAAVVEYWTRQFTAISSSVEPERFRVGPDGSVTVDVRQIVRDARTGELLSEGRVRHRYCLRDGLIARMDVLEPEVVEARYDSIGGGYAGTRREDPRIAARIHAALGGACSVVNIGAGAGSYEPSDRHVTAVEPSDVMAGQRPPGLAPAIRGEAHRLPLRDGSVDAAMAVLAVHHWDEQQREGVREMRRVARGPVVILTVDPVVSARMWLMADYLPEVAELDHGIFPAPGLLCEWLGGESSVHVLPVARDTPDWTLCSFWAHPERVLDPRARAGTSGFARMPQEVVQRVVDAVRRDLQDGAWDARHGHLREIDEYDAGLRLIVAHPT